MLKIKSISWSLAALLAAAACGDEEKAATALVVSVKSDLGAELSSLKVRVYPATADFHDAETPAAGELTIPTADMAKPIVINRGGAGEALVVVRGQNAQGVQIVEYAVRARFQDQESIQVPVFLGAKCRDVACAGTADTCFSDGPGATCGCGALKTLGEDAVRVTKPGDESAWPHVECLPAPPPPPPPPPCVDAGTCRDGDADAGDGGPAPLMDADTGTPCMLPPNWKPECAPSPLCGCEPGEGCSLGSTSDPDNPQYNCEVRGDAGIDARCTDDNQCAVGSSCRFWNGIGFCAKDCASSRDCGNGRCELTESSGKVVANSGICRPSCTTAADCNGGCCLSGSCFPDQYCRRDGLVCTSYTSCAGSGGTKGGNCLTNRYQDGGPAPSTCYSKCNSGSDCATGCCYDNGNVSWCLTRAELTTAEQQQFCVVK